MNCGFGHQLVAGSALDRLQNCTGSSLYTCNTRSLSPRLQFSSKDWQDWCGIFSEMVKRESPTLPRVSFLWTLSPHLISLKLRIVITSLPRWPFHLRFFHLHMRLAVLIWQETLKIASGIWVANEYQRLIITFVILDQKLQRAVLYISWKWQTCRSVYMWRLPKCKMYNEKGEYGFCWSHRCVSFSICIEIATLSDAMTISLTKISFCTHEECSV